MRTLIKGGRVIDPGHIDDLMDVLIEDELIVAMESHAGSNIEESGTKVIDARGKIVTPGLIDLHVHFRDPGYEYKETIESGSKAAAAGGFTAVCPMPNTNPVNDNSLITEYMINKSKELNLVRIYPVASISVASEGKQLSEFGELKAAGAVAVSDDGLPVKNSLLMRRALEYAHEFDLFVISHCEDLELAGSGVMNESALSTQLGLAGIPNAVESIMVMRDIALCELTQMPLHIAHVSTRQSVEAIRQAKRMGIPVTAETAPHYFTLTHDAVKDYDTHAKMNPPLRADEDRQAIIDGLSDGTLDAIATDHAPHSSIEKDVEFDLAANGIIGLETSLSLSLKLVDDGILSYSDLISKMSKNPAKVLGINNDLGVGKMADIAIIDPEISYSVKSSQFYSKSQNTPFNNWELKGKPVLTMVGGNIVYHDMISIES